MKKPPLSIITASAGTGKTYRLAIEYTRILLDYYEDPDFSLDSILVLTFTRKATAEIRERIVEHLNLLGLEPPERAKERQNLLEALRPGQSEPSISISEKNSLLSALREIAADRKKLQVMTIDSYIGSIFRNIVSPLRSIDHFEIDQQAIDKRLPFLLEYLMQPELKAKLENLLRRKVSPSLDEYRKFFASLIDNRWLYYQLAAQKKNASNDKLCYLRNISLPEQVTLFLKNVLDAFVEFLDLLQQTFPEEAPENLFNADFKGLFPDFPFTLAALNQRIHELCNTPQGCYRIYKVCSEATKKGSNIYNGQKLRGKSKELAVSKAKDLQNCIILNLADYLVHTMILPEQEEILDIWKAILDEYDQLIYRYKNMTYNDVAWFTLEALFKGDEPEFDLRIKDIANEFYLFLAHRSRFILIDEFQDTSLLQFSILKPIIDEVISGEGSKAFGGLTVVGDEKQSIFGWRGGERDLLLNLRDIFPNLKNTEPEVLKQSYRSSKGMMEFINAIFLNEGIHSYLSDHALRWDYESVESAVSKPDNPTMLDFRASNFSSRANGKSLETVMNEFILTSVIPALEESPQQEVAILCRKGSELELMQQLLEEAGKSSIYQPSSVLPEHAWVSPLIALLRFLAFRDWLDFLEILRSNYIMLLAAPLKKVVDQISLAREEEREPDFQDCSSAETLLSYLNEAQGDLADICLNFIDLHLSGKEPSERDYLNIHAFISLVQDFELSSSERDKSIPAFLDYLDANILQEFMKQVAVEGKQTLQLLTIHKSKGLQFDRVFVFYNLSGRGGNEPKRLNWYVDYGSPDFQTFDDYALTYHYADVLARSSYSKLAENAGNRALLEELNTLYVAFTRAKTSLHVCMAYESSDDFAAYISNRKEEKITLPHLLTNAASEYFTSKGIAQSPDGRFIFVEESLEAITKEEKPVSPLNVNAGNLTRALPPQISDPFAGIEANKPDAHKDWKKIWLTDRQNLVGDLVHHYLSFVKSNLPEEHSYAARQCLSRFGSILTQEEILSMIELLRRILPVNKIFPASYDKVFTELTFYHKGREMRLDRLLLDTKNKKALILDYKTGGIYRPEQLDEYKEALLNIEMIRKENYSVETEYVPIDI